MTDTARTMFEKIWARHRVADLGDDVALLGIDRHFIHDIIAGPALAELSGRGRFVRNPELTFATVDHAVPSTPGRGRDASLVGTPAMREMRRRTAEAGIRMYDIGQP